MRPYLKYTGELLLAFGFFGAFAGLISYFLITIDLHTEISSAAALQGQVVATKKLVDQTNKVLEEYRSLMLSVHEGQKNFESETERELSRFSDTLENHKYYLDSFSELTQRRFDELRDRTIDSIDDISKQIKSLGNNKTKN